MRDKNFSIENLLQGVEILDKSGFLGDLEIRGVHSDSRKIREGFLFVCVKGIKSDGHNFIESALANGAKCVVYQNDIPKKNNNDVLYIKVKNSKLALNQILMNEYKNVLLGKKFIGITGTNGKTTTTYIVRNILKSCLADTAIIGTTGVYIGNKSVHTSYTTPLAEDLLEIVDTIHQSNVNHIVMEMSSHAIEQGRADVLNFSVLCFTNLTQDHLDYHIDMENYFRAKSKLFDLVNKNCPAVINLDCPYGRRLFEKLDVNNVITYGVDNDRAVLNASITSLNINSTNFVVRYGGEDYNFKTSLVGKHNIYNILSAVGIAIGLGIRIRDIISKSNFDVFVPGRLQRVNNNFGYDVFVDYAHTPDALFNVLSVLKTLKRNRLIVVFGCGGDRDKDKRAKMGRVASGLSDFCFVTSDNPRSEDPISIANSIVSGMSNSLYEVELDRKEAIQKALYMAKKEDIILIAGKGHEDYQIIKDKVLHFDDVEVVEEILNISKSENVNVLR